MSASRVAARYARAFVDALEEKNAMGDAQAFLDFCDMVAGHDELRALYANVTVDNDDKANVTHALADKAACPDAVKRFLTVLANGGRLPILAEVKVAVAKALDEKSNIQSVHLTTATEPTDAQIKAFADSMAKRLDSQVRVDHSVEPEILGGAVASVGSTIFDGSVRGQLSRLRRELVKEN